MTFLLKLFAVTDSENDDIDRLELKINFLILISAIQAIVLTFWILGTMLLPSSGTIVIALLAVGGFLFLFRKRIPAWSGGIFRMIVNRLSGEKNQSRDASIKSGDANIK
jgi:hypothetical protein